MTVPQIETERKKESGQRRTQREGEREGERERERERNEYVNTCLVHAETREGYFCFEGQNYEAIPQGPNNINPGSTHNKNISEQHIVNKK